MYSRKSLLAAPFVVVLLVSVTPSLQAPAYWTVMVYMDGDNNLEGAAIDDLNELEVAGSTSNVNVVVQCDRINGYDASNGDWTGCRRYEVATDTGYDTTIVSVMRQDLGEVNMGDPDTLIDFVTWAKNDYPAEHYLLVLWDHGSGWKAPVSEPVKSVCTDDTSNDSLSMRDLRTALESVTSSGGCPLDIVGFDACLMGMLEVDYDIMPYAHYRVGSQEVEPFDGWDYIALMTYLNQNSAAPPAAVAREIVRGYMAFYGKSGGETQSAVHVNPTSHVVDALDIFACHLAGAMQYKTEIQEARTHAETFFDPDYIDLYHFAALIHGKVPLAGIQKDAEVLMNAIQNAVTAEGHGILHLNAHGISIYFPDSFAGYQSRYENDVELTGDTFWDEFLNQYYSTSYPLGAEMSAEPNIVGSGEIVTVSMEVTNVSGHTVTSVTPSSLTVTPTGSAHAVLDSGPAPLMADLTDGQSVIYTWTYQVFGGMSGGTLTFWGNAHGIDFGGNKVFSPLVASNPVTVPGANLIPEKPKPDPNEQMRPVANNRVLTVERSLESLRQQFAALEAEGKDTTPCEDLLALAEEYLARAQENYEKGNYIAANYWALQATAMLEEAEECLENL